MQIKCFIKGKLSVLRRRRGDRSRPGKWKRAIIDQTRGFPTLKGPCKMNVDFYFEPTQHPKDLPFGPDIDNHLKSFQDALNKTIFRKMPGTDSCILEIHASKRFDPKKTGADMKIVSMNKHEIVTRIPERKESK